MLVVVLADTHLAHDVTNRLPTPLLRAIERADLVLHAGDVTGGAALEELQELKWTVAVLGNNDHELRGRLPEAVELELEGVRVAMVHDSGSRQARAGRLKRRFSTAQIVVFGHSHVPVNEAGLDDQLLFNPGSPTYRRAQPTASYGLLELTGGKVVSSSIERL